MLADSTYRHGSLWVIDQATTTQLEEWLEGAERPEAVTDPLTNPQLPLAQMGPEKAREFYYACLHRISGIFRRRSEEDNGGLTMAATTTSFADEEV